MTPFEILTQGKALINTPDKWIQGTFARNDSNLIVNNFSEDASKFCSHGALRRVSENMFSEQVQDAFLKATEYLTAAAIDLGYKNHLLLNDNSSHEVVMQMWDRAIESIKGKTK